MRPEQVEQVRLLAIFHYVFAGVLALMACIPFVHMPIGLVMLFSPRTFQGGPGSPPPFVGLLLVVFAGLFIALGWAAAALLAYSGRCLTQRRRHAFCTVMAAIACIFVPLGTVLGVFTLVVLSKPEVKAAFDPNRVAG